MTTFAQRFKEAREKARLTQQKIADEVGLKSREAVSAWERGESEPRGPRLRKVADVLGVTSEWLADGRTTGNNNTVEGLPLRGDVASGVWHEAIHTQEAEFERAACAPDPNYPAKAQFALRVRDESANEIAQPGATLSCVNLEKAGIEARHGDVVLVERNRGDLVEYTVKRLRKAESGLELLPVTNDPAYQETLFLPSLKGTAEIQITAVIIYVTSPIRRGP